MMATFCSNHADEMIIIVEDLTNITPVQSLILVLVPYAQVVSYKMRKMLNKYNRLTVPRTPSDVKSSRDTLGQVS